MSGDRSTTPPALRIPVLILLAAWTCYFGAAYHAGLQKGAPWWLAIARWQMFTLRADGNTHILAEQERDGVWTPLDLPALFPTRWESGYRYDDTEKSHAALAMLAAAACGRMADPPVRIRLLAEKSRLVPGVGAKVKGTKELLYWECGGTVRLPAGVRW